MTIGDDENAIVKRGQSAGLRERAGDRAKRAVRTARDWTADAVDTLASVQSGGRVQTTPISKRLRGEDDNTQHTKDANEEKYRNRLDREDYRVAVRTLGFVSLVLNIVVRAMKDGGSLASVNSALMRWAKSEVEQNLRIVRKSVGEHDHLHEYLERIRANQVALGRFAEESSISTMEDEPRVQEVVELLDAYLIRVNQIRDAVHLIEEIVITD